MVALECVHISEVQSSLVQNGLINKSAVQRQRLVDQKNFVTNKYYEKNVKGLLTLKIQSDSGVKNNNTLYISIVDD